MEKAKIFVLLIAILFNASCNKSKQIKLSIIKEIPNQVKPGSNNINGAPNILLIVSDDLNTNIGPYRDIEKYTPNLDRLAQQGITFKKAYSQYPLCGPSRASFMSGLYPERNKILGNTGSDELGSYKVSNPSLSNHPSMAGFFREQGYFTARVSKIFHMGVPGGIERGDSGGDDPDSWDYFYNVMGPETLSPGTLELLSPGNLHYGSNFSRMIIPNNTEYAQTDYLATSQAIAILENRASTVVHNATNLQKLKKETPFFLAVGLVRPHVPLIAPKRCYNNYPDENMVLPEVLDNKNVPQQALGHTNSKIWKMNTDQKKKVISGYMASVQFMDEQVGRLLDALNRLDLRKKTIVVFMSDHGYNLGEHDSWSKVSLWEGSIRVPLIISIPGHETPKGIKNDDIVELIDVYPTLSDLCGLSKNQPKILQGKSLVPYIKDEKIKSKVNIAYTVSEKGKAASIRTPKWRYTLWGDEPNGKNEELYNHITDPEEHFNLATDPSQEHILKTLRNQFKQTKNKAQNHY